MYSYDVERQEEVARSFGEMLRVWREQNGWTQYTAYKWAKQAGFAAMAPSTVSVVENGKAPKPRPESFFALAEVNRRLAMGEFAGITDAALGELVREAKPLRGDDGKVWGPADFWSCHVGLLAVPKRYETSGSGR